MSDDAPVIPPEKALKRIDHTKGWFIANGKKYVVETGYSIERYAYYQRLSLEAGFGVAFSRMFAEWEEVIAEANELRFSDVVIRAYNMSRGIMNIEQNEPAVLKLCALFLNRPDEDRRFISDDLISDKIRDWKEEGIAIEDFFILATATISGFTEVYRKLSQTTTELAELLPAQSPEK
jgi:hypothetical protein